MREAPYIQNLWANGGPFIGDAGQPHSRVTVQMPWGEGAGDHPENVIFPRQRPGRMGVMSVRGNPIRWYQKADNSQVEREVPNIQSITIDRSIDQDAATCSISMYNQWMYENVAAPP